MKIGICLSSSPAYSETFLISKIRGISETGHSVHVFLLSHNKHDSQFNYILPLPFQWNLLLPFRVGFALLYLAIFRWNVILKLIQLEQKCSRSLSQIIKTIYSNAHILKYDLDWLHFEFATLALKRENLGKAIGAKLSVSLRGFDISIYPLKHKGCYSLLWKTVDKIHTISDDLYQAALEQGLPAETAVVKIKPAIDLEIIPSNQHPGRLNPTLKILTVGRLEWKKGYEYALIAMKRLKDERIDFTYNIIGAGSQYKQLQFLIWDSGLQDRVFLKGKMLRQQVMAEMGSADIYIQPSVQEGFCNSLLEAQGCGLLCIATNAEGLAENVIHGRTGFIIPKRDPDALVGAIKQFIALSEEDRRKVATAAIQRLDKEFRLEDQIMQFEKFYSNY